MGSISSRKGKIVWLKNTIQSFFSEFGKDTSIDREKLIANFVLYHSSTRRTCIELLKILEEVGEIKQDKDFITNA